jgi:hypothetical protein
MARLYMICHKKSVKMFGGFFYINSISYLFFFMVF